jgi:hypothetical protein
MEELDNTIVLVLPHNQTNLSSNERRQRFHGPSTIHDAIKQFEVKTIVDQDDDDTVQSTQRELFATACVLYHRYIHAQGNPNLDDDIWSISMASLLLASKLHDIPITVECIIHTFCIIYRQRILLPNRESINNNELLQDNDKDMITIKQSIPKSWKQLSVIEQRERVNNTNNSINTLVSIRGPIYKEWYDAIVQMECKILYRLGYHIHWIPDHHAYQFVVSFCSRIRILPKLETNQQQILSLFIRTTYEYCHKALHIDLCVQYIPQLICCGAICCSAVQLQYQLLSLNDNAIENNKTSKNAIENNNKEWWNNLWDYSIDDITTIQSEIYCILGKIWNLTNDTDYIIANCGYIPSNYGNSVNFRNPGSVTWEYLIEKAAE